MLNIAVMEGFSGMMNIAVINGGSIGSTGTIMYGIRDCAQKSGYYYYTFSPRRRSQKNDITNHMFFGSIIERKISERINIFTGYLDSLNYLGTRQLLKRLSELKPDIIHLHNLHGNFINLRLLFNYIKNNQIKVVWTLHDCWAFTGQCAYFTISSCSKWRVKCHHCSYIHTYPASRIDRTDRLYIKKKNLFTGIDNMTIVTPSQWLRGLVDESFLRDYPVQVINNGIDTNIFQPHISKFREENHLGKKFIILGISWNWGVRKGGDRFDFLAEALDDRFQIVLVGNDRGRTSGGKIINLGLVGDQIELAKIFSAADVFLNTTREDNFPTVNLEALACGTPVISYGAGGSAEAYDNKSGITVTDETVISVLKQLYTNNLKKEDCIKRGHLFEKTKKFQEYVKLYKNLTEK